MYPAPTLAQLIQDRQQDRLAAAAVHRLVPSSPARVKIAPRTGSTRRPPRRSRCGAHSPAVAARAAAPASGFFPDAGTDCRRR